jgi:hypothetical protein
MPPSPLDYPARGKILRVDGDVVVFNPAATTYELRLTHAGGELPKPSNTTVSCYVRATARKIWTMASGGNFVTPIFGPPKVVQGMVRYLEQGLAVVHAGLPILLTLPPNGTEYDLINGPVVPGVMVNATLLAGASFELVRAPVPQS